MVNYRILRKALKDVTLAMAYALGAASILVSWLFLFVYLFTTGHWYFAISMVLVTAICVFTVPHYLELNSKELENHGHPNTTYDYTIIDEKKFTMFALRWGHDT